MFVTENMICSVQRIGGVTCPMLLSCNKKNKNPRCRYDSVVAHLVDEADSQVSQVGMCCVLLVQNVH